MINKRDNLVSSEIIINISTFTLGDMLLPYELKEEFIVDIIEFERYIFDKFDYEFWESMFEDCLCNSKFIKNIDIENYYNKHFEMRIHSDSQKTILIKINQDIFLNLRKFIENNQLEFKPT